MSITLLLAVSKNGVIGDHNKLPWKKMSSDMKRFKELTLGGSVLMGRKTYDSLPSNFKPLPGRTNYVLSRTMVSSKVIVLNTVEEVLKLSKDIELFVIGGSEIFEIFLKYANKVMLTVIQKDYTGDSFFLDFLKSAWTHEWKEVSYADFMNDDKNEADYSFITYERIREYK